MNKFTKFTKHINQADEVISAEDTNKIQDAVNEAESAIIEASSETFFNKFMFTFQNSLYVNSMFIDEVKSMEFVNMSKGKGIIYDDNEKGFKLAPGAQDGFLVTMAQSGLEATLIDDFIVSMDAHVPKYSALDFYLSCDGKHFYPIEPNTNKTPLHLGSNAGTQFMLKVAFRRNAQNESPVLKGYGVMFYDLLLEKTYGMVNPDLKRFVEVETAGVVLVRDRAQGDKVVKVVSDGSITELNFDLEKDRLSNVVTNDGVNIVQTDLIFGDYLNSQNKIEEVLLRINTHPQTNEEIIPEDHIFVEDDE